MSVEKGTAGKPRSDAFGSPYPMLMVLFAVNVFSYVDRSLLSVLQVPIKHDLGLSDTQLGALTGVAFALVYSTVGVPISWMADRVSRTRLMATALVVWSIMTALSGFAGSFAMLVFLRMGVALGESACVPTGVSLNSDLFPRERRGFPMALIAAALPLGTMIGLAGAGWFSESLGWRHTFIWIGLAGLLLVPALTALREPPRGRYDERAGGHDAPLPLVQAVGAVWRSRAMRYLVIGNGCQAFTYCALNAWSAPFYSRIYAIPLAKVGLILGLMFGLVGGIATLLGGFLSDRLCRRHVGWYGWFPAGCVAMVVPAAIGQFFAPTAETSIAFGVFTSFFLNLCIAPIVVAGQALATPFTRALTASILAFAGSVVGNGLGPLTTGILSDVLEGASHGNSLRWALLGSLLGSIAAAAFFVAVGREIARNGLTGKAGSRERPSL